MANNQNLPDPALRYDSPETQVLVREKIRAIRESHNYGQRKVATEIKCTQGVISKVESGIIPVPWPMLQNLCKLYGKPMNFFFEKSNLSAAPGPKKDRPAATIEKEGPSKKEMATPPTWGISVARRDHEEETLEQGLERIVKGGRRPSPALVPTSAPVAPALTSVPTSAPAVHPAAHPVAVAAPVAHPVAKVKEVIDAIEALRKEFLSISRMMLQSQEKLAKAEEDLRKL